MTIWIASVDARHMMAEYAEGKGETMVVAKEIASRKKISKDTLVIHAEKDAANLDAPYFQWRMTTRAQMVIIIPITILRRTIRSFSSADEVMATLTLEVGFASPPVLLTI
jgi:hypothetical protein